MREGVKCCLEPFWKFLRCVMAIRPIWFLKRYLFDRNFWFVICKWIVSSETVQPDECTYYATDQTFLAPPCTRTMVRKYYPYIVWVAGWVLDGTFLKGNSWFSPPHPHPALPSWRNEDTSSLLMQSMCIMVIFPSDICDLIFFNVNRSFLDALASLKSMLVINSVHYRLTPLGNWKLRIWQNE